MSSFGLFLIMCAALFVLIALIRFLAWLTELQEAHGSLPRAGVHALQRYVTVRRVNNYTDSAPHVMSRSEDSAPASSRLSNETQVETDRQTEPMPAIRAEQLLTIYKTMRAAGISREDAAAAFKASGLPFNNNVWAKAAPPQDGAAYVTPIVGRPTSARFETDSDFPYQSLG